MLIDNWQTVIFWLCFVRTVITHELISVTNDTYITSKEVCELLHKLGALPLGVPITLFLDNARYQKCRLVITTAARLQIELCFLPTYSPNLNLIERLWRFVKKRRTVQDGYCKLPEQHSYKT